VERHSERPSTGLRPNALSEFLTRIDLATGDHDIGAMFGEGEHHLTPKASTPPGDKGDAAGEIKTIGHGNLLEE